MSKFNPYPIPKRYMEPSALAARERLDVRLSRWARSAKDASGAILIGPTGIGKTLAVSWFASRVVEAHGPTWLKWIRADELSRMLSERNSQDGIHELKQARVLVIDELGYERFPELVLEVLGIRHDNNRPVITTSGLTAKALSERYSDSTVRRIVEVGDGCVVDCTLALVQTRQIRNEAT